VPKKANWRDKLHPAFGEVATMYRKGMTELAEIQQEARIALGPDPTTELKAQVATQVTARRDKLLEWMDGQLIAINGRYGSLPPSPLCYPWLTDLPKKLPAEEREARGLFEWLHWERHGESLNRTMEADAGGDIGAWRRISRTAEDWRRVGFKKGKIKPFQGNPYHSDLLQFGLSFGSGMEKLTAEELADCFDFYCPCGKCHDADALKKQRARVIKLLKAALHADRA
jgi:hypothetical protein